MADIKELVIDRSKWFTGEVQSELDYEQGLLYCHVFDGEESRDMFCCLGMLGQQCGVELADMRMEAAPSELSRLARDKFPSFLLLHEDRSEDSQVAVSLMRDNDAQTISREEREERIKNTLEKHGITVKFIGEYPKFLEQS